MKLDIRRRGFTSGLKKYSIDVLLLPRLFPVTRYLVSPYEQKFQFRIFEVSNVLRYSQFSVYTHLVRNFRKSKNSPNIVARFLSFTLIKISENSRLNVGNSKRASLVQRNIEAIAHATLQPNTQNGGHKKV